MEFKLGVANGGRDFAIAGDQKLLLQLQRIPGSRMQYSAYEWLKVPASRLSALTIEAAGEPSLITEGYLQLRAGVMRPSDQEMKHWLEVCPSLLRKNLAHQDDFCAAFLYILGYVNASEQGTGKTQMTMAHLAAWRYLFRIRRVLILGPKSPLIQWEGEFETVMPAELRPLFIHLAGSTNAVRRDILDNIKDTLEVDDFLAVTLNYDVVADLRDSIMRYAPDVIVMDESWRIKTHDAQVTKAMLSIINYLRRRNPGLRVICLNGTPYTASVGDLWPQVVASAGEGITGSYRDWMRDYSESTTFNVPITLKNGTRIQKEIVKYGGIKDPVGLMARIAPVYWRATKDSCLDLPEKLPEVRHELILPPNIESLYRRVLDMGENALLPKVEDWHTMPENFGELDELTQNECEMQARDMLGNISLAGAMTHTLRLQQILSGFLPTKLTYDIDFNLSDILGGDYDTLAKTTTGLGYDVYTFDTPKQDWFQTFMRDIVAENTSMRIIVWCNFNYDVYNTARIAERYVGAENVVRVVGGSGGIKDRDLEDAKKDFNDHRPGGRRVFCVQVRRMAFGHNLQGCDHNVIYSSPWDYLLKDQLEDRSHRLGRRWPVAYTTLIAKLSRLRSVDNDIIATLDMRDNVARRLTRDTTAFFGQ